MIEDGFLVKGLNTNLISISQLCDQGLTIKFNKVECIVTNKNHEMVMKGSKSKNNCYLWISHYYKKHLSRWLQKGYHYVEPIVVR